MYNYIFYLSQDSQQPLQTPSLLIHSSTSASNTSSKITLHHFTSTNVATIFLFKSVLYKNICILMSITAVFCISKEINFDLQNVSVILT